MLGRLLIIIFILISTAFAAPQGADLERKINKYFFTNERLDKAKFEKYQKLIKQRKFEIQKLVYNYHSKLRNKSDKKAFKKVADEEIILLYDQTSIKFYFQY